MKKLFLIIVSLVPLAVMAGNIPNIPLDVNQSAKPMTMIVSGRDHKMYYEAYNDASDLNGDGEVDIRFKPDITYLGLFDSNVCYEYRSSQFVPSNSTNNGKCSGKWSGNWLNYITTSRIDALRVVLYGGYRVVDTDSATVLRRAYIPQDAHSWAKEYTGETVDGYRISDYTPLSAPGGGLHHFFGNLTPNSNTNCSTLSNCSDLPPWLSVVTNTPKRVWEWASSESPVLSNSGDGAHGGTRTNYVVDVSVCTASFHAGCKQYPNGNYKPVGLLHEYGEDESMLFGLLTGSYNKNTSGGVLRKVVSSFAEEIDFESGVFTNSATIVKAFDSMRIRGYNDGGVYVAYGPGWPDAWITTRAMTEGEFVDWGNPVAEMMYEAVRYFAGKGSPTADYFTSGGKDADVGLSPTSWDDPYDLSGSVAKAPYCAKPNLLVVSDINPSYDSDQLPGSYFNAGFSGDLSGMDVSALANAITADENGVTGSHFIGQSQGNSDGAPTAKTVTSLASIRGLAPEEPTKLGSYYSASVAYYAKKTDISSAEDDQNIDSYFVALASPLPQLDFPVGDGRKISLVPFAKSVGGCLGIHPDNSFIPTNQIVDYYITKMANVPGAPIDASTNGGRPYIKFAINFEDVEQAADHDMDAIAEYEVALQADGKLKVDVASTYASGCIVQHLGYVVSGTTADGIYLVVRDIDTNSGDDPDYSLDKPNTSDDLPLTNSRTFEAGNSPATFLKNPLWYAAKWGGFIDSNGNDRPDLQEEWDADADGVPDTYFLVKNPTKLRESLAKAFDEIVDRGTTSASNVTVNSASIRNDSLVFQALYKTEKWTGDLVAYPITDNGVSSTASWDAASLIPAPDSRKIFTTSNGGLVQFAWSNLNAADKAKLNGDEDLLNYIRGERSKEQQNGGGYRDRGNTVLGDLVHSSPYYVDDTDTVYVGGNDGMLHAFDGASGAEVAAYIPSVLLSKLEKLADPSLTHAYFVDGDIAVTEQASANGKNLLVATLGRGGKGLFGLNVTSRQSIVEGWEYFNSSDDDLGYMLGKPILADMNDGSKAVIVGNGYNSTNGSAVLYVFNLESGALLSKIRTQSNGDNGLSTPGVFDSDGDGDVDYIYAGDLKGNVWKFNVSSSDPDSWTSAYDNAGVPEPLFTAKNSSDEPQPITAPVTVAVDTVVGDSNFGKTFVFFGTGQYVFSSDPADQKEQSWYAVVDSGSTISGRTDLKERGFSNTGTANGLNVRTFDAASANDMAGYKGWYLDWNYPNSVGERVVTQTKLYNLVEPTLLVSSIIPISNPCLPGGTGFINLINPFTGGSLTNPIIDMNGDDTFDGSDRLDGEVIGSVDPDIGMPGEPVLVGDRLIVGGTSAEIKDFKVNLGAGIRGRLMWREIVR